MLFSPERDVGNPASLHLHIGAFHARLQTKITSIGSILTGESEASPCSYGVPAFAGTTWIDFSS
jgi:hypothetical protein